MNAYQHVYEHNSLQDTIECVLNTVLVVQEFRVRAIVTLAKMYLEQPDYSIIQRFDDLQYRDEHPPKIDWINSEWKTHVRKFGNYFLHAWSIGEGIIRLMRLLRWYNLHGFNEYDRHHTNEALGFVTMYFTNEENESIANAVDQWFNNSFGDEVDDSGLMREYEDEDESGVTE